MSARIQARFALRRAENRAVLIAYLVAGDPDPGRSHSLMHALIAGGVDLIELGCPFAHPALDGPVVSKAHARALAAGGSLCATIAQLARFRETDDVTPVLAMGYSAALAARGWESFAQALAQARGDGAIVADLRLRDARSALLPALAARGLVLVPLASPTRRPAGSVDDVTGIGGFFYAIPAEGPTGGRPAPEDAVASAVARARACTALPIAVGFGIRTPAHAADAARLADAVVVGSALVEIIAQHAGAPDAPGHLTAAARTFRDAIDAVH